MQDHNSTNQEDLILKLDQDRAWLLENLDKGKWSEIRSELEIGRASCRERV